MLRIAICDDCNTDRNLLSQMIHEYSIENSIAESISLFESGEEFLHSCCVYDIVFMDIHLPGLSGIQTVREYQYHPMKSCIVFVTQSERYAAAAFGLNALHYIRKPVNTAQVTAAMEKCISCFRLLPVRYLMIQGKGEILPVITSGIQYIEVFNKKSVVHTRQREIETYTSLSRLYESLDPDIFLRIQRSYIVNMHSIGEFHFDHILMKNKKSIPLSRMNRGTLKMRYQEFLDELAYEGLI